MWSVSCFPLFRYVPLDLVHGRHLEPEWVRMTSISFGSSDRQDGSAALEVSEEAIASRVIATGWPRA